MSLTLPVIYVIDARTILTPLAKVDIDWDTVQEPPPCGPSTRPESELLEADPTGVDARLHLDDIEAVSPLFPSARARANGRSGASPRAPTCCRF